MATLLAWLFFGLLTNVACSFTCSPGKQRNCSCDTYSSAQQNDFVIEIGGDTDYVSLKDCVRVRVRFRNTDPYRRQNIRLETAVLTNITLLEFSFAIDSQGYHGYQLPTGTEVAVAETVILENIENISFESSQRYVTVENFEITNATVHNLDPNALKIATSQSVVLNGVTFASPLPSAAIKVSGGAANFELNNCKFSGMHSDSIAVDAQQVRVTGSNIPLMFLIIASQEVLIQGNYIGEWTKETGITAPNITLFNNTFGFIHNGALRNVTTGLESRLNDSPKTTFRFESAAIQELEPQSLELDWKRFTFNNFSIDSINVECSCSNLEWFSHVKEARFIGKNPSVRGRQSFLYKKLVEGESVCLGREECSLLQAVGGIQQLCDSSPHNCFLDDENATKPSHPAGDNSDNSDTLRDILSNVRKIVNLLTQAQTSQTNQEMDEKLSNLSASVEEALKTKNGSSLDFVAVLKDLMVQNQVVAASNAKAVDLLRRGGIGPGTAAAGGAGETHAPMTVTLVPNWFLISAAVVGGVLLAWLAVQKARRWMWATRLSPRANESQHSLTTNQL